MAADRILMFHIHAYVGRNVDQGLRRPACNRRLALPLGASIEQVCVETMRRTAPPDPSWLPEGEEKSVASARLQAE